LQRFSPTTVPTQLVESTPDLNSQIEALHDRLRALPDGAAADRQATSRVLLALDARASSVQARVKQLRRFFLPTHPTVLQGESEERAIDERRSQIRTTR
jgi:hypothetical protein